MEMDFGHYNRKTQRYNAGLWAHFGQKHPIMWLKRNWKIESWASHFSMVMCVNSPVEPRSNRLNERKRTRLNTSTYADRFFLLMTD
jgi:hypothetical protein